MVERLRAVLEADPRIAYALLFGSRPRGKAHAKSDLDVAVGLSDRVRLDALGVGELIARMEAATGTPVDLVLLDEAPPGLAYRIFRDGTTLVARDERALKTRRSKAILDYLDFQPIEEACARAVLASRHGR